MAAEKQKDILQKHVKRAKATVWEAQEAANPGVNFPMPLVTSVTETMLKDLQEETRSGAQKRERSAREARNDLFLTAEFGGNALVTESGGSS